MTNPRLSFVKCTLDSETTPRLQPTAIQSVDAGSHHNIQLVLSQHEPFTYGALSGVGKSHAHAITRWRMRGEPKAYTLDHQRRWRVRVQPESNIMAFQLPAL
jgi:hypothetical protein